MASIKTKEEIFAYVQNKTRSYTQATLGELTANEISKRLNVSRALASQYLNELVKDGTVIKISSRPVYFLNRKVLEDRNGIKLGSDPYLSVGELERDLSRGQRGRKDFDKLIGGHGGLSYEVEQCKAAIKYPPNGLPILITGQVGTGRGYLASLVFEYAVNSGLLPSERSLQVFCCGEYEDPQMAAVALFGTDDRENIGALRRSVGGMLYIADVQCLSRDAQDRLAQFLDTGGFWAGTSSKSAPSGSVRLVLSTGERHEENISKKLLRRLPVVIRMPALSERSVEEREQLILHFFRQETDRMDREVYISNRVFSTLLQYEFPANIEQMKNCIQTSCANGLVQMKESSGELLVYLYHLPEYLMVTTQVSSEFSDEQRSMVNVRSFGRNAMQETAGQYYNNILSEYESYRNHQCSQDELLARLDQTMGDFFDYLFFSKQFANAKSDALQRVMEAVFDSMTDKYFIHLPAHFADAFSRCLYLQVRTEAVSKDIRVAGCLELLIQQFPRETVLADEISRRVEQSLDISVNGMSQLLLILGLRQYSQNVRMDGIRGIIICHGYSTASSIASVANRLNANRVFEAIDMPINVSIQETATRFKRYINHVPGPKDAILLVDMGSLEDMHTLLNGQTNLNLGIINNVSTALAVHVGNMILEKMPMREILETATQTHFSTFKLVQSRPKKAAVLFVSEAGATVARRMAELFNNSLPRQIEVEFLSYDYLQLKHTEGLNELKAKYEVLFISGTIDPELDDAVFIPMEDIISFREIKRLNRALARYMQQAEIEEFNQRLLKNFSLQNVVQYLTILNADKVLDLTNVALDRLQRMLRKKFSAQTVIGLNIHICCLVERLVTKTPIETYTNQDTFEREQQSFIKMVHEAFQDIRDHYRVEIPISEVAYIYDYIIRDSSVKNQGGIP